MEHGGFFFCSGGSDSFNGTDGMVVMEYLALTFKISFVDKSINPKSFWLKYLLPGDSGSLH
jgi:hypothetical protein